MSDIDNKDKNENDPYKCYESTGETFTDKLALNLFGMTLDQAHKGRKCISCKRSLDLHSLESVEVDEWLISGYCPRCFADLTEEKEDSKDVQHNKRKIHIER